MKKRVRIEIKEKGLLIENCSIAKSSWSRMVGLLNQDSLDSQSGLLIVPCKQVHSFFMRFPIDVIFLDKELRVVGIEKLKTWRLSKIYFSAKQVLELRAGKSEELNLKVGDQLEMLPC